MPAAAHPRLAAITLAFTLVAACATLGARPGDLSIEAVSNRADLVSGGDVLVRVTLPAEADPYEAVFHINGRPASVFVYPVRPIVERSDGSAVLPAVTLHAPIEMARASDGKGWLAMVKGLSEGENTLTLDFGGRRSSLSVTNHPNGGPILSGPQIQPWPCRPGATSAQCDRPAAYSWSYMPKGGRQFQSYDPAKPAADVATTTTSDGVTVPYIVRVETFTQNRSGVSVAVLYDPAKPWTPFAPQPQWNKGVYVLQGSGCGTGYGEAAAGSPLNDRALAQGFAVATVALLHNTVNCNPIVQAEAAIMAKEHVAETYGLFDLIFAQGSSGGAISQIADQNAYPGLYDGLILNHLFADSDASRRAAYDCRMVLDAWARPGALPWTDAQKAAVVGMVSGCTSSPSRFEVYHPSIGTGCNVPRAEKFDPATGQGVRCTLQDYQVNQVGRRPDGYAHGRLDTEGVQYGLNALKAGTITPAQFVELNAAIGGHDINFNPIPTRTVADRAGLKALYTTGLNNGLNNLSETPIIETRYLATDFHQVFHHEMVLARLDRAQGRHDNYVTWRSTAQRDASFNDAFDVMVAWIKAIKADTRNLPKARKVIDNKPPAARDRCTRGDGRDLPKAACPRPPELARVLAGAPDTNDAGKCRLKVLDRRDYGSAVFTDAQWASLRKTFPTGVCDYSRPPVDFGYTTPWLTYGGDGRFEPMPRAPIARRG